MAVFSYAIGRDLNFIEFRSQSDFFPPSAFILASDWILHQTQILVISPAQGVPENFQSLLVNTFTVTNQNPPCPPNWLWSLKKEPAHTKRLEKQIIFLNCNIFFSSDPKQQMLNLKTLPSAC